MLKKLFMKRLGRNQKGVTLIELMAVVVILGIIAGVAGAAVTGSFSKAKDNTDAASQTIVREAVERYILENSVAATSYHEITVKKLVDGRFLSSYPKKSDGTFYTITVADTTAVVTFNTNTSTPSAS
ncbi:Type II secretion system protein G precursor [compost metagenome]